MNSYRLHTGSITTAFSRHRKEAHQQKTLIHPDIPTSLSICSNYIREETWFTIK